MKVVDEALLDTFRAAGGCELCGRFCRRRHPHHIFCKGIGGGGRLDIPCNLIALCPACHHEAHQGNILRDVLLLTVARRENLLIGQIEQEVYRLRRRKKP